MTVVLTEEGRLIGLPGIDRFMTVEGRKTALLKSGAEIGLPLAIDAAQAFRAREMEYRDQHAPPQGPIRFASGGVYWWGQAKLFNLAADQRLVIAILVPEGDLLGSLPQLGVWIILITLGVLVVSVLQAVALVPRYSRLDLEPGEAVESTVAEVQHLASAHERMRTSLRLLLRATGINVRHVSLNGCQ